MKLLRKVLATVLALSTAVNAVDEGQTFVENVGVYVYKSIAPFEEHIKGFVELYAGAHYYAQTKYSSDYWNAIGNIDLRYTRLNLKKRVAIVSLNVLAQAGGCDIGIENEGSGWFAFFYVPYLDKSDASDPYNRDYDRRKAVYPDAQVVSFSIDAKIIYSTDRKRYEDQVIGSFKFYGKSSTFLGQERLTFYLPRGRFFKTDGNGKPILRFTRFMSLVPAGRRGFMGCRRWFLHEASIFQESSVA
jgi:hypothetical protein